MASVPGEGAATAGLQACGRVLVADDDPAVRGAVERALLREGYEVTTTPDGGATLEAVRATSPDVVVLDIGMPVLDGLTVCRVLRTEGNRVPILMLTARAGTAERVEGLDAGADDYLVKPFALEELLARLRALLRRLGDTGTDPDVLSVADLRLDPAARRVWRAGEPVELSKTEFDLLELLMRNAGIVLEHSTIYDRIWGYDFGPDSKNLAVYIGYLRRKIDRGHDTALLHTVRGVGYTLREA